ncbi:MAG TPA: glycosyltransferase family 25 protein [Casimicrobiaceae bacterium]|nr:glycosyltransferase family 25 protein [Casimicrobiaceae bacterium]
MLFLINLDSACERRARMEAQLASLGLVFRRVGIDFRGRSREAIDAWLDANLTGVTFDHTSVSSAEIGCWVSHLSAWQALAASNQPSCAVLEDDLMLDDALPQAVAALRERLPRDLVFLGTSCRNVSTRRRESVGNFTLHRPIGTIYNTWGYVVSRAWVERFFAACPWHIDRPIDHYTGGSRAGAVRPQTAVLRPPVVSEDEALGPLSQIEPYTYRIDRSRLVERARRRILASRLSELYYRLYRFF